MPKFSTLTITEKATRQSKNRRDEIISDATTRRDFPSLTETNRNEMSRYEK
jgi:hypothetical protein